MMRLLPVVLSLAGWFPVVARAQEVIENAGVKLSAEAWNRIGIDDAEGKRVMTFQGFLVKGVPDGRTLSGEVRNFEAGDGAKGVEVRYATGTAEKPSPVTVTGRFVPRPWRVDVEFEVAGLPDDANVSGSMFLRSFAEKFTATELAKPAVWTRHRNGGVPYEVPEGQCLAYDSGRTAVFVFGQENKVNTAWKDDFSQHAGLKKPENGISKTSFSVVLAPGTWSADAFATCSNGRPVSLVLGSDNVYHWWTDAAEPAVLKASLANVSAESREIELTWWARDYSGKIQSEGTRKVPVKAGTTAVEPVEFRFPGNRAILFVEVSAKDAKTGAEAFARTNLTVMPPHEFNATSENSLFGISAYWPIPTEEDARRLMLRMGVRWLRHGDNRNSAPITAIHHSNPKWSGDKVLKGAEREAWIRKELQRCVDEKNPWWEFGNELNMSTAGIAMEGVGIGQALLAEPYVEWLKEVHRIRKEMGAEQVKILFFGIAGMDLKFVDKFAKLGGWDYVDGFALHPGRGNVAPDYPVTDPFEPWKVAPKGGYWNYYGSVKTAALMLKETGGNKPLWLTEIYAPTFPNSFWEDSMRHATENLVLTFALAKAEGVKSAMWYQLFDSVWHNRLGASDKDREYHFGLVNRDLSLKPLIPAFAATAEALDEAEFVRWIRFPDAQLKGLLFESPRGPVAILWSRKDGYTLSKKVPDFPSPEAWTDTWKTRTKVKIAGPGKLTVVDPIGAPVAESDGGELEIELSGSPVIVRGLDATFLEKTE